MTDLRKAAEMALKVLEHSLGYSNEAQARIGEAKQALRQALAQPEQEPVAWINKDGWFRSSKDADVAFRAYAFPLYAGPKKKEWIGLADDELPEGATYEFDRGVRWAEAKLKEKNT